MSDTSELCDGCGRDNLRCDCDLIKADDKCVNCHKDYADHNYDAGRWVCPHPRMESGYGGFHGGDPRTFYPDGESCTPAEIDAHRRACEIWDAAETRGETPEPESEPSGWISAGDTMVHVLRMPYGIGVWTIEIETEFEADEIETEFEAD